MKALHSYLRIAFVALIGLTPTISHATDYTPTDVTITSFGTNKNNWNWIVFSGLSIECRYGRVWFDFTSTQGKAFQAAILTLQSSGTKAASLSYRDGQSIDGNTKMCTLEEVVTAN